LKFKRRLLKQFHHINEESIWPPPPSNEQVQIHPRPNKSSTWLHTIVIALIFTLGCFIDRILSKHYIHLVHLTLHNWTTIMSSCEFVTTLIVSSVGGLIFAAIFRLYAFAVIWIILKLFARINNAYRALRQ